MQFCIGLAVLIVTWTLPVPSVFGQDQAATQPEDTWLGIDGEPIPFKTEEHLVGFLRTATIVDQKELQGGINRPLKLRLEQDGVAANAIFRLVDVKLRRARLDGKLVADFHDSYIYECAAYQLSRLLGIDNVPPCVRRKIGLNEGTVQLWIENASTEKSRKDSGKEPPEQLRWLRQKQTMYLFDALIYNFDRNQGNMLIDQNWKLWFIDHTRTFRKSAVIEKPDKIIWCDREIWENLKLLDKNQLIKKFKPYLTTTHINFVIKRRDKLVDQIQARIDRMGEGSVIYSSSDVGAISSADLAKLSIDDDIPETSSPVEEAIEDH